MAPTVMQSGGCSFHFFSNEGGEPPHVHVRCGNKSAKFWLDPVQCAHPGRFSHHELNQLEKVVESNKAYLLKKWGEFFAGS